MGNHRFRFSDMIPNAWFYKLKDMSKTSKSHSNHPKQPKTTTAKPKTTYSSSSFQPKTTRRSSSSFKREANQSDKFVISSPVNPKFSDTQFPRKSSSFSGKKPKRKTIYKPSPSPNFFISSLSSSSSYDDDEGDDSEFDHVSHYFPDDHQSPPSDYGTDQNEVVVSCNWTTDIIIDLDTDKKKVDGFHDKDSNFITEKSSTMEETNTHQRKHPRTRKSVSKSSGIKLRSRSSQNSPRVGRKKVISQQAKRKSSSSSSRRESVSSSCVLEGFAVVKSTIDPERDFRESMVEMILENGVKGSKDLENLLACYLSLNSKEYHGVIIRAFEQIWFDLNHHHQLQF